MRASREHRAERLQEAAEKTRAVAGRLSSEGSRMADIIPMGQPILIGHYSERRDRAYRERINSKFAASSKAYDQAEELERMAQAAASNTAIYSDSADPVADLDARIAELEAHQENMKKANALIKKISAGNEDARAELVELVGEKEYREIMNPMEGYRCGYESFTLTNNSANIRRLKQRRESLAALKATGKTERMVGEVRVVEDPDIARIQLFYPSKPDQATRDRLKRNGFRWAPSEGAWQRQLNNAGRRAAQEVLR